MPDEHDDDAVELFSDFIAEAKAQGQDVGSLTQMRNRLKRAIKEAQTAETRGYERARSEIQTEGARRTAFDRLGIPSALEGLFAGIDPTDSAALDTKAAELKAGGIQWQASGATPPEGQQQPDRTADQVAQMAAATAGGQAPVPSGDLQAFLAKASANPGSFTDAEIDKAVEDVNLQIRLSGSGPSAGSLG